MVGDDASAEVDSGADTEVATAALVTADAEVDAVVADDAATADVGSEFDARAGEGSTSGDVEGRHVATNDSAEVGSGADAEVGTVVLVTTDDEVDAVVVDDAATTVLPGRL